MEEITVNLHNHSVISDGTGNYYEIAQAGLNAKIDVLIITDHNVVVRGKDSYYYREGNKLLLLIGEEINDPIGVPGNHLIILNSSREYASAASDPQTVIDSVNKEGGITILAHPFENAKKQLHMKSFPWSDWSVHDFLGLEIYNFMSQFKCGVTNFFSLPGHYLRPINFQMGADENTLAKWDELLSMGYRVSGFAGSDSHRFQKKVGPKTFKIFDYELTCRALNNHVYIPKPLVGDVEEDKKVIYAALRNGCFFVGADMITSTAGFSFRADTETGIYYPGARIPIGNSATLKIRIPEKSICRLISNGKVYKQWESVQSVPITITEPGYYRVECYLPYKNKLRGWIYSNPIYFFKG
ncbi:MAG TPA: CehA/McbA family metallohydrolase [Flexilinea sp.]|nr:CehA/McbA family metallohydrolase [Flexilinea sp.]